MTSPFMARRNPVRRLRKSVRRLDPLKRVDVKRSEFNRVIETLNERAIVLGNLAHNQEIQFKRIAQLQAEIDALKRQVDKISEET
jgi:translation initiation factor 6 (eIF-6)